MALPPEDALLALVTRRMPFGKYGPSAVPPDVDGLDPSFGVEVQPLSTIATAPSSICRVPPRAEAIPAIGPCSSSASIIANRRS